MLSFEPEAESLRPLLGDRAADILIARERREVFSVYPELRICAWAGVMLIATAAGIVLQKNLDRIGPLALAILMGAAAAACYAWTWWHRARPSLADDYVLLLGALLLSADAGFIETQFHLLGHDWHRHFLFLAVVHGITAYFFGSRMVLSLSITALAAWLGIEQRSLDTYDSATYATRAYICAIVLLVWHALDRRVRPATTFSPLFQHFAANLILSGSIALMFEEETRLLGCAIAVVLATFVILWGFRTRRESFVLYAFLYGVAAIVILVMEHLENERELQMLFAIVATIASIITLIAIHSKFKGLRA